MGAVYITPVLVLCFAAALQECKGQLVFQLWHSHTSGVISEKKMFCTFPTAPHPVLTYDGANQYDLPKAEHVCCICTAWFGLSETELPFVESCFCVGVWQAQLCMKAAVLFVLPVYWNLATDACHQAHCSNLLQQNAGIGRARNGRIWVLTSTAHWVWQKTTKKRTCCYASWQDSLRE